MTASIDDAEGLRSIRDFVGDGFVRECASIGFLDSVEITEELVGVLNDFGRIKEPDGKVF